MFCWAPLRDFYLKVDGANRILVFVTIIAFLLNISRKSFVNIVFKNSIVKIWTLWVVYAIINTAIQDGFGDQGVLFGSVLYIIAPLLTMQIVIYEYLKNEKVVFKYLIPLIFITGLIYVANLTSISITTTRNRDVSFGNGEAILMTILIFITCLAYKKKYYTLKALSVVVSLSFFMIIFISTRKAFIASFFIIIVTVVSDFRFNIKNIVLLFVFSISIYSGTKLVFDKTALGKRFMNIKEEGERYNKSDLEILNYLGDRAVQYSTSPKYFLESPLFGIGLRNYVNKTPSKYKLHSELLVQLVELGIVGIFLYFVFNYKIALRLKKYKKNNNLFQFLLYGWIIIIFFSISTWTYQFSKYFMLFGILIAEIIKYENRYTLKNR